LRRPEQAEWASRTHDVLAAATWLPLWSLMGDNPIMDVIAVLGLLAFGAFLWRNRSS
jgi:hypothetical protein